MKHKQLKNVVDNLKGRFVSLLVKNGEQRRVFSAKVTSATSKNIMFLDTNGGRRRVSRRKVLRATCSTDTFKRSA